MISIPLIFAILCVLGMVYTFIFIYERYGNVIYEWYRLRKAKKRKPLNTKAESPWEFSNYPHLPMSDITPTSSISINSDERNRSFIAKEEFDRYNRLLRTDRITPQEALFITKYVKDNPSVLAQQYDF